MTVTNTHKFVSSRECNREYPENRCETGTVAVASPLTLRQCLLTEKYCRILPINLRKLCRDLHLTDIDRQLLCLLLLCDMHSTTSRPTSALYLHCLAQNRRNEEGPVR